MCVSLGCSPIVIQLTPMRHPFGKLFCWIVLLGFVAGFGEGTAWSQAPGSAAQGSIQRTAGVILAKRVKGKVWVVRGGSQLREAVKEGDNIWQKDTVLTDKGPSLADRGSVVLVFANGATVNLSPDTELRIEDFLMEKVDGAIDFEKLPEDKETNSSLTRLKMARGELVGKVKALNKNRGSSFDVETPAGAAGIRGTTFRVVFRPDPVNPQRAIFSVQTQIGTVEVSIQGSVSAPVGVSLNQEIVVEIPAVVNPQTGQITVTAPPTIVPPSTPMTVEAVQMIQTATQAITEAVQNVVIPPAAPPPSAQTTPPQQQQQSQEQGQGQQQQPDQGQQGQGQQQQQQQQQQSTSTVTSGGTTATATATVTPKPTTTTPPTPPPTPPPPRTTSGAGGPG